MKQVVSFHYDTIFKKVFGDRAIFTAFVKDILGIEIEIEQVLFEKRFAAGVGLISPKIDLFAEDVKNRIIVEIQHRHYADHYHRFLYYHCLGVVEQCTSTNGYRAARTVYTIVVHTSPDEYAVDRLSSDWALRDEEGRLYGDIRHKLVFLNTHFIRESTPAGTRLWLDLIQDSLDGTVDESRHIHPLAEKALALAEADELSPEERAKVIEDGYIETTRREGRAEGFIEGLIEGEAKGREAGLLAGKLDVALTMLAQGLPIEQVVQWTGVSQVKLQTAWDERQR